MNHFHKIEVLDRELLIYLPPSYQQDANRRYEVAYVQDGGELFQLVSNQLDHLAAEGRLREMIFVGLEPHNRNNEYTPWPAPSLLDSYPPFGGNGREYVDELADQVKPYIDEHYRTKSEAEHTAIIGGSFGGLISLFAGYWRPDTFGRLGLLSASFWYEGVMGYLKEHSALSEQQRIFMSVGDCEGIYKQNIQRNMVPYSIEASRLLVQKGFPADSLRFELRKGGTHDGLYMAESFLRALDWLFPSERVQVNPATPQADENRRTTDQFSIPNTRHLMLRSRRTGREYRIFLYVPQVTPPKEGFPVLYSLDGNATFGSLAEAMRLQGRKPHGIEPQVIVGIGYDSEEPIVTNERFFDYTTAASPTELPQRPDGSEWPDTGGAEAFSAFIEEEVKPLIESLTPVNRKRQSLFGHSLGGFFALHMLFNNPNAFGTYIAGSPSIWWKEHELLKRWPMMAEKLSKGNIHASVLIGMGDEEKASMVEDAKHLVCLMKPYESEMLRVKYREFEGEGHISVLHPLISEILRII